MNDFLMSRTYEKKKKRNLYSCIIKHIKLVVNGFFSFILLFFNMNIHLYPFHCKIIVQAYEKKEKKKSLYIFDTLYQHYNSYITHEFNFYISYCLDKRTWFDLVLQLNFCFFFFRQEGERERGSERKWMSLFIKRMKWSILLLLVDWTINIKCYIDQTRIRKKTS